MISLRKSFLACLLTGFCSSVIADTNLPPSLKDGLIAPLPTLLQHQSTFLALGDDIHWRNASGKSLARLKLSAELLDWRYPVQLKTGKTISSELVAATVFLPMQKRSKQE